MQATFSPPSLQAKQAVVARFARRVLGGVCLLLGSTLSSLASAQQLVYEPTPSPEAQCLTKVGEIDYPAEAYQRDTPGRVKVALSFSSTTSAPDVEVLSTEGGASFEQAVRAYVKKFRVTCMSSNAKPAHLQLDFLFQPDNRQVYWDAPAGQYEDPASSQFNCIRNQSADEVPRYPQEARGAVMQANCLRV